MPPLAAPTQAVILAAGLGSRLRPLTLDRPKPLVEVHGTPILHNALRHLAAVGIKRAAIVVGYQKEAIKHSCGAAFSGVDITYIESDAFDRTGSAYSLWLARECLLENDALLLEGDVFFSQSILSRLLDSTHSDVAAVAPFTDAMSGSAVTLSQTGQVRQILMNQTCVPASQSQSVETSLFKTINLYRFAANTLRSRLVPALDRAISGGDSRCYVEQVLSRLVDAHELQLGAVTCGDINWFEIDSIEDLQIAERIFAPPLPIEQSAAKRAQA